MATELGRGYITIVPKASSQFASVAKSCANQFNNQFKSGIGALGVAAGNLIASGLKSTIGGLNSIINEAIGQADVFTRMPIMLETLGFSADQSAAALERLNEGLKGYPTLVSEGASAVARMTASNGDLDKSVEIFLALNDAVMAGGAASQVQAAAIEQFQQAIAKGKPDRIEFRSFMQAFPGVMKQVAASMGMTTAELQSAFSDGKITMDQFAEALVALETTPVEGFKTLKEQALAATTGIEFGFKTARKSIVQGFSDIIESMNVKRTSQFFTTIGDGLQQMLEKFTPLGSSIGKGLGDIIDGISAKMPDLIKGADQVASSFRYVVDVMTMGGGFDNLKKIFEPTVQLFKDIGSALVGALPRVADFIRDHKELCAVLGQVIKYMTIYKALVPVLTKANILTPVSGGGIALSSNFKKATQSVKGFVRAVGTSGIVATLDSWSGASNGFIKGWSKSFKEFRLGMKYAFDETYFSAGSSKWSKQLINNMKGVNKNTVLMGYNLQSTFNAIPGWAKLAAAGLVVFGAGIVHVYNHSEKFRNAVADLGKSFERGWNLNGNVSQKLLDLSGVSEKTKEHIQQLDGSITDELGDKLSKVAKNLEPLAETLGAIAAIKSLDALDKLNTGLEGLNAALGMADPDKDMGDKLKGLKDFFTDLKETFGADDNPFKKGANDIQNFFNTLTYWVTRILTYLMEGGITSPHLWADLLGENAIKACDGALEDYEQEMQNAGQEAQNQSGNFEQFGDAVGGAGDDIKQDAEDLATTVPDLGDPVAEMFGNIKKGIDDAWGAIQQFFGFQPNTENMEQSINNVDQALDNVDFDPSGVQGGVDQANAAINTMEPTANTQEQGTNADFAQINADAGAQFGGLPGNVVEAIGDVGRTLFQKGVDLIGGLWEGAKSIWDKFTGWLSNLFANIPVFNIKINEQHSSDNGDSVQASPNGLLGTPLTSGVTPYKAGVSLGRAMKARTTQLAQYSSSNGSNVNQQPIVVNINGTRINDDQQITELFMLLFNRLQRKGAM